MSAELSALVVVGALFILTNGFWAYTCHILVNKLMSRNYGELVTADVYKKTSQRTRESEVDQIPDYAATQAEKANQLFFS